MRGDAVAIGQATNSCRPMSAASTSRVPYFVMELLPGHDLGKLLRANGPLDVPTAADYIVQACDAVIEAHAAGIVHRDLKPGNLFVTQCPRRQREKRSTLVEVEGVSLRRGLPPEPADPVFAFGRTTWHPSRSALRGTRIARRDVEHGATAVIIARDAERSSRLVPSDMIDRDRRPVRSSHVSLRSPSVTSGMLGTPDRRSLLSGGSVLPRYQDTSTPNFAELRAGRRSCRIWRTRRTCSLHRAVTTAASRAPPEVLRGMRDLADSGDDGTPRGRQARHRDHLRDLRICRALGGRRPCPARKVGEAGIDVFPEPYSELRASVAPLFDHDRRVSTAIAVGARIGRSHR